ncbi:MAG: PQQ-binding-like beta-propeller repeat protein [Verrucomicrobiota bacterium]
MRLPAALLAFCLGNTLAAADAPWPEFRGPTAQGTTTATGLPLEWSPTKNVTWKQPVPGSGWSSPVVGGGRIYLTTGVVAEGVGTSLRALGFDAATGKPLWDTEVFTPTEVPEQHPLHNKNSPASPTAILEGDRVYVHFGHHGTACLDVAGKILWRNNRLRYDPMHGNGGSPLLVDNLLVFSADGIKDPFVIALDKTTGEVAWKVPRTVEVRQKFSFCTPLLITVAGQRQIVIPGSGAVSALDPKDGREIWHARYGNGYSVVPRPVFAHDLLFIATGYNRADLLAVRPDGTGDVTDTHIAWRTTKGAPLTPSLVVVGDELYGVNDGGIATCWDARTGEVHWQQRIDGNFSASPLATADRIYFQSETGTGTVVKASKTFEQLAVNKLDERSLASYAVLDRALLIRTAGSLYRIEEAAK